jgi:MerR family transcriptional regulator/heat shock protein HspR
MTTRTGPDRQERATTSTETESRYRPARRQDPDLDAQEQPRYVISIAAQILGVHPQTLRLYEREGLVEPQRSGGKIRLYSESDIERVRAIMRLTNDLGVNLAGAEAILYMRERMLQLHEEMERMRRLFLTELEALRRELDVD